MDQIVQSAVLGISDPDRIRAEIAANRSGSSRRRLRRADQQPHLPDGVRAGEDKGDGIFSDQITLLEFKSA